MNTVLWKCKSFDALTTRELYSILRLRNEVFVVEQNCIFQDADDKDQECHHLAGYRDNQLAAYARIVPAGVAFDQVSIGRFVTAPALRKLGLGKLLMQQALNHAYHLFGRSTIKIGAQLYLKNFYESFSFVQVGEVYDEDGIPHIHMLKD